jgi:secreted trypsin-like serine protease
MGSFGRLRTDHPRRGRTRRRVLFTIVVATLALMMTLAGGPAALAATKRLPIKSGPNGVSRDSGGISTKIVGGTAVPNGKYKFQAARLAQSLGTNDWERQYCGGSLTTPFEVLTAAHCVEFVGDFDAAVVHLASPINGIRPIALVTPGVDALERPGTLATVTGWGNTIQQPAGPGGGGVNHPDRTREAQVPITSRAECQTVYTNAGAPIDATMLCAGRTNLDTCQGDSGGPLFFKAAGGGFIQAGITSWGIGCGATGFPGVYTRLSNRGVGNFILSVTGGVPVNSTQAA